MALSEHLHGYTSDGWNSLHGISMLSAEATDATAAVATRTKAILMAGVDIMTRRRGNQKRVELASIKSLWKGE